MAKLAYASDSKSDLLWVRFPPSVQKYDLNVKVRSLPHGEVAEWLKAAVLKTAVGRPTGSSNLSLSAMKTPLIRMKMPPESGRFGAIRKYDIHTGFDLHIEDGSPVFAIETGRVVSVMNFTGPEVGSPWWLPTKSIMIESRIGVFLYGEVIPKVSVGDLIEAGTEIANVSRVLRHDKGLPTSMLHIELYDHGINKWCDGWGHGKEQPKGLLNPEPVIIPMIK